MELTSKVFALGNSNAVRLSQFVMETLSLHTNDAIIMEITDNKELIIKKKETVSDYPSVKELFEGYNGDYKPSEMDAEVLVGREII